MGRKAFFDLGRNLEGIEDRFRARIELNRTQQVGLESFNESQNELVLLFAINPDRFEIFPQTIPQDSFHDIIVVMDQRRRWVALAFFADVEPEVVEEEHVSTQVLFGHPVAGRTDNEAAGHARIVGVYDLA